MESRNSCLKYFERPEVAELVSSRLAPGLELRLFQTFLRGSGVDPFETMDCKRDAQAAAREGRFGGVKWLVNCMKSAPEELELYFTRICKSAASGGHLHILKWLRRNRCTCDSGTCAEAAGGGHLDILKWLRKNKCP